ncbi:phage baseplate protein [Paraburkholderia unamae]|uniref:Dit-like phage tail protein N-terminal domain-containing protein n=1 Tax=Paraburkholderia unamae TaxID=219649 RepID=A0ABX5K6R6_9BURK|nr:hypothetical protein [Paraburkholderia unamae]PVX61232.1 hypothetical protein C7402_14223 [Paraburkholderia unamae]
MANGVPALWGQVANVVNTVGLLAADAVNVLNMFAGPQWGIFNQDGTIAIQPDSMVSLDFRRDWKIPNYPVEQGSFESYNKVALPSITRIRITKGGTVTDRQSFLLQISAIAASLDLYNIVMPEGALIQNVNIVSDGINRTSTNGVGLLSIDLMLEEVRVTATASFSNTAAPSGADPVSTGSVQPQTPTTAQDAAAGLFT